MKNDPAFPQRINMREPSGHVDYYLGVTKRQWFAAQAMQGMCTLPLPEELSADNGIAFIVEASVRLADALIAELEKEDI